MRGLGYLGRFLLYNPVLALTAAWVIVARRRGGIGRARTATRGSEAQDATGGTGALVGEDLAAAALRRIGLPVVAGYLAYVVLVGGDFKQTFRFIVPVLPLVAILLDAAVSRRVATSLDAPASGRVAGAPVSPWLGRVIGVGRVPVVLLIAVLLNSGLQIPASADWVGRRANDLVRREACGLYLKSIAAPDDVLAIQSAGIIPYYSELPTLDMWGITNAHIAHKRIPDMGRGGRRIGHEKHDDDWVLAQNPTYFIDQFRFVTTQPMPDLIEQVFPPPDAREIARRYDPHSVPLRLDLGQGPREYWFNYISLKNELRPRRSAFPRNEATPARRSPDRES